MAAIYQWFENLDVVYTTTLYPIVAEEQIFLGMTVESGYLEEIFTDYYEKDFPTLQTADMVRWLWDLDPIDDEFEKDFPELISISMFSPLVSLPEFDDEFEKDFPELISASMEKLLIVVESPPEELHLGCAIESGAGCYLDPV